MSKKKRVGRLVLASVLFVSFILFGQLLKGTGYVLSAIDQSSQGAVAVGQIFTDIWQELGLTGDRQAAESGDGTSIDASVDWQTWDEDLAPNYVETVGLAQVRRQVDAGQIYYAGLDSLGRAGLVAATLTHQMREQASARGRQDIDVDPAGWPLENPKVDIVTPDGGVYRGYFWNRSHLLADSLGGDPRADNLVTGTRMQNVGGNDGKGGMAYAETIARDWLDAHEDGTLYYSALPMYEGDEVIPRAVIVDMKSSDGSIDAEIVVHNAAKGYRIDYSTGAVAPS